MSLFRNLLLGSVLLVLSLILISRVSRSENHESSTASAFTLVDLDGETIALEPGKGEHGALLFFFSSWCPHCSAEAPKLDAYFRDAKEKGVRIYAINIRQDKEDVLAWQQKHNVSFPVLLDADGAVAKAYGVTAVPTLFAITPAGEIASVTHKVPEDRAGLTASLIGEAILDQGGTTGAEGGEAPELKMGGEGPEPKKKEDCGGGACAPEKEVANAEKETGGESGAESGEKSEVLTDEAGVAHTLKEGVKFISKETLSELQKSEKKIYVVDVLAPASYDRAHIAGAINIPLAELKKQAPEKLPAKDAIVITYCASYQCGASTTAAKELTALGYEHVYDYKGGIAEWKEAKLPTESVK